MPVHPAKLWINFYHPGRLLVFYDYSEIFQFFWKRTANSQAASQTFQPEFEMQLLVLNTIVVSPGLLAAAVSMSQVIIDPVILHQWAHWHYIAYGTTGWVWGLCSNSNPFLSPCTWVEDYSDSNGVSDDALLKGPLTWTLKISSCISDIPIRTRNAASFRIDFLLYSVSNCTHVFVPVLFIRFPPFPFTCDMTTVITTFVYDSEPYTIRHIECVNIN